MKNTILEIIKDVFFVSIGIPLAFIYAVLCLVWAVLVAVFITMLKGRAAALKFLYKRGEIL